jgi:3-oxoacyl-[acyl-carrier protein] reductase
VCIVTGSSSGIGAATALLFAQRGHDVVINYSRQSDAAERVAEQCRDAGAACWWCAPTSATTPSAARWPRPFSTQWGQAEVLVNSAGIATKFADLKDLEALSAEDFEATYRVNVIGTFQMSRALAPLLQRGRSPAIVNISSIGGRMGTGSSIAYSASKGAVNTLTLSLARALSPTVRVNAILPGMVDGEWLRRGLGEEGFAQRRKRWETRALLASVIQPEDVARTAYWLACDAVKVTGQLVQLDAGFMLG